MMAGPAPGLSLSKHRSLRERIVTRLRYAIVAGRLAAKSRLTEPELARRLGVSRTPLREAIRQLEAEGFLRTVPRAGTFVSEVSPRDVEETYAIRAVLEGLAARLAAENPEPAKAGILGARLADLGRKTRSHRAYHEAAGRFHRAIFLCGGNRRLLAMYDSLSYQISRFRSLSLAVPRRPAVSLREHQEIASAILEGRAAEAERLMRTHVDGARAVLRRRIGGARARRRPARSSGPPPAGRTG